MKKMALGAIKIYQKTISPDHGFFSSENKKFCRFVPTCSEYTYQSIEKKGVLRGSFLGMWRILRCNPFSKGGYDPVSPEVKKIVKKGESS